MIHYVMGNLGRVELAIEQRSWNNSLDLPVPAPPRIHLILREAGPSGRSLQLAGLLLPLDSDEKPLLPCADAAVDLAVLLRGAAPAAGRALELEAVNAQLREQNAQLREQNAQLREQNARLAEQLAAHRAGRPPAAEAFGPSPLRPVLRAVAAAEEIDKARAGALGRLEAAVPPMRRPHLVGPAPGPPAFGRAECHELPNDVGIPADTPAAVRPAACTCGPSCFIDCTGFLCGCPYHQNLTAEDVDS